MTFQDNRVRNSWIFDRLPRGFFHPLFAVILLSAGGSLFAEGIRDHLKIGASNSHDYAGRNVFYNPAAIGFQKSLNGPGLFTAASYTSNTVRASEFDFALNYSLLGLGWERLSTNAGQFNRFSFSTGSRITSHLYSGLRFSLTSSDNATLSGYNSLDWGLQYRPSKMLSFGLLVEAINQPVLNGSSQPTWFSAGLTVRPIEQLDIYGDIESPSNAFGSTLNYLVGTRFRVIDGVQLEASYHKTNQFQFGLRLALGPGRLGAGMRPQTADQSILVELEHAYHKPFRSLWMPPTALKLKIDGSIREEPIASTLFSSGRPAFLDLLQQLDRARQMKEVRAVYLDIRSFPLGYGAAEDLWEAIWEVRKAGKRVEAYLGNAGLKEYFIATAANEITLNPSATISFFGPTSSRYYFKGTLDKIGIKAEIFAKGKYKSAPEAYQRKKASKLSREETLARLRESHQILEKYIEQGRAKANWKAWMKKGVFGANEAVESGLVDGLEDTTIALEKASRRLFVRSYLSELKDSLALPKRVSVVVASGDILSSPNDLLTWTGRSQITPKKFSRHLKYAASDPQTEAIVVRVSSPGGSILPSQRIASMLEHVAKDKPVYVSMGDVAASGGYMLSAPATKIFAQELSVTGSIGVFLGKANMKELFKKIDLNKEVLGLSPYAGLFSEHRGLQQNEIRLLKNQLNIYYDQFVSFVAQRRDMKKNVLEPLAQGRVWLGSRAAKNKLVDGNKSYLDTIRFAAQQSGLSTENLEYRVIRSRGSLFGLGGAGPLAQSAPLARIGKTPLVQELLNLEQSSGMQYRSEYGPLE